MLAAVFKNFELELAGGSIAAFVGRRKQNEMVANGELAAVGMAGMQFKIATAIRQTGHFPAEHAYAVLVAEDDGIPGTMGEMRGQGVQ